MAGKRPAFQMYPGDWLRDPVAGLSFEAQACWLRMMFIMHDSTPYGELRVAGKPMGEEMAASLCGKPPTIYRRALQELMDAGVPSVREDGTIYSRRMVKDEAERQAAAERMRNSRRTSAQQTRNTAATSAQLEDEDEDEDSLSSGLGGAGGKGPIDGDPWGKPVRVPVSVIAAEAERRQAARSVNPHLAESSGLLREFGFNVSNAAKYGASLNATPDRVRWLCSEAKRLAEAGKITEPVGYVIAGIRSAKDPDPGPVIETPEAQLDAVLARRSA